MYPAPIQFETRRNLLALESPSLAPRWPRERLRKARYAWGFRRAVPSPR